MTKQLKLENNNGLLFPSKGGTATGAIRLDDVYYSVSNSSTTEEGTAKKKTLNISFKDMAGKKAIQLHFTRSKFTGKKAPNLVSQEFVVNGVDYQVVAWIRKTSTGNQMISMVVNEVNHYEFDI